MWRGCLLAVLLASCSAQDAPVGQTQLGNVSGTWQVSRIGRRFAAFQSVPYAKPPTGRLRFQAPERLEEKWQGVYNSTSSLPVCLQNDFTGKNPTAVIGTENCLYLSVFTPNVTGKAPVLAHIHGGAFVVGNAGYNEPHYLMDEEIVVVRINYRLNVMGFLSFEDDVVPGNQGMKDQVLGLRWIQDNIAGFGGDPARVTIIGESAGGVSIYHHTISPLTKGLFHQAIAESGTSYASWSVAAPGDAKSQALQVLKAVNCSTDTKEGLPCLYNKTAQEVVKAWMKLGKVSPPVLEKPGTSAYLVGPPSQWEHKKIPILMGVTSAEGLLKTYQLALDPASFKKFSTNFDTVLPSDLCYDTTSSNPANITQKIREFYLPNGNITMKDWVNITTIFSDGLFIIPGIDGANNHTGDVYFYFFDYKLKELTPAMSEDLIFGASHCAESYFIWRSKNQITHTELLTRSEDIELSKKLVKLVGSFVRNGVPVIEGSNLKWEKWTRDHNTYIHVNGSGSFVKKEGLAQDRYRLWKNMDYRDMYERGSHATSNRISTALLALVVASLCYKLL